MYMPKKISCLILFSLSLLVLYKCKKDNPVESEPDENSTPWVLGESKTYTIPNTTNYKLEDNISGKTFVFPDAGGGEFVVSKIISGDRTTESDKAFSISYKGSGRIQIIMKGIAGLDYIIAYTPIEGNSILVNDGLAQNIWLPVSGIDNKDGTLTFTLPYQNALGKVAWQGCQKYKSINVTGLAGQTKFKTYLDEAVNNLVKAIPTNLQQSVNTAYTAAMKPTLYVDLSVAESAYQPFNLWGYMNRINFVFHPNNSDIYSVGHETGHYIHHVLLKDAYSNFSSNPRPAAHCIAMKGAKNNIIEEPAFLSEYYLNGVMAVKKMDPELCNLLLRDRINNYTNSPEKDDWLDLEGVGVALAASLIRSNGSVTDYKGRSITIPVINTLPDKTLMFQDVWEFFTSSTNNTAPKYRDWLLNLCLNKWGGYGNVPIIWQAMGYSHHVKMRFVDKNQNAVSGVTAQNFIVSGNKEYTLPKNTTASGNDGKYTLPEIYPSISSLRIFFKRNGQDVQLDFKNKINIDWNKPTNVEIDLGDIVLDNLDYTKTQVNLIPVTQSLNFMTFNDNSKYGDALSWQNAAPTGVIIQKLEWQGTSFIVDYEYTYNPGLLMNYKGHFNGEIDYFNKKLKYYYATVTVEIPSIKSTTTQSIIIENMPCTITDASISASAQTMNAQQYVTYLFCEITSDNNGTMTKKTISGFNWANASISLWMTK
jgi:hypothetical protein